MYFSILSNSIDEFINMYNNEVIYAIVTWILNVVLGSSLTMKGK